MSVDIGTVIAGAAAGAILGFLSGIAVNLVSRLSRHAGEINRRFPVWKIFTIAEAEPSKMGTKKRFERSPVESATHAVYVLTIEFNNSKDLDVTLGDVRVVFEREGHEVITHGGLQFISEDSPIMELNNPAEPVGTIYLPSRQPVRLQVKGYLHNLGGSDELDQLRKGYDRVIFRAIREDGRTVFERTIRESPDPLY